MNSKDRQIAELKDRVLRLVAQNSGLQTRNRELELTMNAIFSQASRIAKTIGRDG